MRTASKTQQVLNRPKPYTSWRAGYRADLHLISPGRDLEWLWFCGHCGQPPHGTAVPGPARICERCGLGLLVESRSTITPTPDDAFVIVNAALAVQAVSERAEHLLGVEELDAVDRRLGDFVVPWQTPAQDRDSVERLITSVALSDDRVRQASFALAGPKRGQLRGRIGTCGPPRGAVIILERRVATPHLKLVAAEPVGA